MHFVALSVAASIAIAPVPKAQPKVEAQLVGMWVIAEIDAPIPPVFLEFFASGKLEFRIDSAKVSVFRKGTYTVEGKKLCWTLIFDKRDEKEVLAIQSISDNEFVTEDSEGNRVKYKRVSKAK